MLGSELGSQWLTKHTVFSKIDVSVALLPVSASHFSILLLCHWCQKLTRTRSYFPFLHFFFFFFAFLLQSNLFCRLSDSAQLLSPFQVPACDGGREQNESFRKKMREKWRLSPALCDELRA